MHDCLLHFVKKLTSFQQGRNNLLSRKASECGFTIFSISPSLLPSCSIYFLTEQSRRVLHLPSTKFNLLVYSRLHNQNLHERSFLLVVYIAFLLVLSWSLFTRQLKSRTEHIPSMELTKTSLPPFQNDFPPPRSYHRQARMKLKHNINFVSVLHRTVPLRNTTSS
jgi:hypothetical protein